MRRALLQRVHFANRQNCCLLLLLIPLLMLGCGLSEWETGGGGLVFPQQRDLPRYIFPPPEMFAEWGNEEPRVARTHPSDIAFDATSHHVFLLSGPNVLEYDRDGTPIQSFRPRRPPYTELPHAITVAPGGRIFLALHTSIQGDPGWITTVGRQLDTWPLPETGAAQAIAARYADDGS